MVSLFELLGASKLYHPGTTGAAVAQPAATTTYSGISPIWIIIIITIIIAAVSVYLWYSEKDD